MLYFQTLLQMKSENTCISNRNTLFSKCWASRWHKIHRKAIICFSKPVYAENKDISFTQPGSG